MGVEPRAWLLTSPGSPVSGHYFLPRHSLAHSLSHAHSLAHTFTLSHTCSHTPTYMHTIDSHTHTLPRNAHTPVSHTHSSTLTYFAHLYSHSPDITTLSRTVMLLNTHPRVASPPLSHTHTHRHTRSLAQAQGAWLLQRVASPATSQPLHPLQVPLPGRGCQQPGLSFMGPSGENSGERPPFNFSFFSFDGASMKRDLRRARSLPRGAPLVPLRAGPAA